MYDLTNLDRTVAIFEIDDTSFHGHARFARFLDEKRALGHVVHPLETGIGHWQGETNTCYVMDADEFRDLLWNDHRSGYLAKQDAVLFVHTDRASVLEWSNGRTEELGEIDIIDPEFVGGYDGFTMLRKGMFVVK